MNRDIVTIGASAGGVELLLELAAELPADLAAALFVVVHLPSGYSSELPVLLSRRGPLPARHPEHGEAVKRGVIYIAPPDNHLQLADGKVRVVRGPRENGHRPAVDALFRSASSAYAERVIGVVLSGYQDCGTAGLMSIKARGGVAVVQDPDTAVAPDMPRSALNNVDVDHVVHPLELPGLLKKLVSTPAGAPQQPTEVVLQLEGTLPGAPAPVVCPICEGVLTETQPGVFTHFRCHVGHTFSLDALVREQGGELERVLWAAVRALEESAALARRMAQMERDPLRQRFVDNAATHQRNADQLKGYLLHSTASEIDAKA